MSLYIKDNETVRLVAQLARSRGVSKQEAVRIAVQAELTRAAETIPLRERFAALRRAHPLPPPTGKATDKSFSMRCPVSPDKCLRSACRSGGQTPGVSGGSRRSASKGARSRAMCTTRRIRRSGCWAL